MMALAGDHPSPVPPTCGVWNDHVTLGRRVREREVLRTLGYFEENMGTYLFMYFSLPIHIKI